MATDNPRMQQADGPGGRIVRGDTPNAVQTTEVTTPRDRVSWGGVWAGLLTALGAFLILTTLAITIGAQVLNVGAANATNTSAGTGIATLIIALISFFVGGWVAAHTAAVRGRDNGILNGFLVWALGTAFILALAGLGLGQLFGALGNVFGQMRQLGGGGNVNPQQVANNIQDSALVAFLSLLIPALCAMIGGIVGSHPDDDRVEAR